MKLLIVNGSPRAPRSNSRRYAELFQARWKGEARYAALTAKNHAELAAAYGYGLARNHPFIDGNKRTAFVAVELFLALNGWALTASDADCVLTLLSVAAGEIDEPGFADWIRRHSAAR